MKKITFEITDEQAKRWEDVLCRHFAKNASDEALAKIYCEAGLNVLTRLAMFQFIMKCGAENREAE